MKLRTRRRVGVLGLGMLCAVMGLGAGIRPPGLADVTDVRTYPHPGFVRVVVEVSRPVPYEAHELTDPPRFYIDIGETWIEKEYRDAVVIPRGKGVRRVRGGQNMVLVSNYSRSKL